MKHRTLTILILLSILLGLAACSGQPEPVLEVATSTAVVPTRSPAAAPRNDEYLEIFELVWQTIDQRYFDPTFGGVDWDEVHERYQPLVASAEDDEAFYTTINEMLFELGVSHMIVLPPSSPEMLEPVLMAEGSAGIDVRLIEGQAVVVSVEPGSPGEEAGLRPGYVLQAVGGVAVAEAEELVPLQVPPYTERRRRSRMTAALQSQFYGQPGDSVSVVYLDEQGEAQEVLIELRERAGEATSSIPGLPPMYLTFESRRLKGGVGYIRFNSFQAPIRWQVVGAINDMAEATGIIIDLRGNPGGTYPVRKAIAEQFFAEKTLFWTFKTRDPSLFPGFEHEAYLEPPLNVYQGPLVILVDVLSASSAEEFSGGMQATGRATIVGERTAGVDLVADIVELPNGAIFLYPMAETRMADGTVLEKRGVIPDVEVALDPALLLQDRDSQLEAALDVLGQ
jgi:carboxyl-terminal processing protease